MWVAHFEQIDLLASFETSLEPLNVLVVAAQSKDSLDLECYTQAGCYSEHGLEMCNGSVVAVAIALPLVSI